MPRRKAAAFMMLVTALSGCGEATLVVESPLAREGTLGATKAPDVDAMIEIRSRPSNMPLTWTAKARQPWLSMTPATGSTPRVAEIGFHVDEMVYGKNIGTIDFTSHGVMTLLEVTYVLRGTLQTHPNADILLVPRAGELMSYTEVLEITSPDKDGLPWTLTTTNPAIFVSSFKGVTPAQVTVSMKMTEIDSRVEESICVDSLHIDPDRAHIHRVRILSPHVPSEGDEIERRKRARRLK